MGMCLVYRRVSPHDAKLLASHPSSIHRFLDEESDDIPQSEGFLSRLFGRTSQKEKLPDFDERTPGDEGDADKAWHAIHYLLTEQAEGGTFPEGFILEGGDFVGSEDVGYGPARIFSPDEISQILSVLDKYTDESLREKYDGGAMDRADVYPQIWGREGEDNFSYAWENFALLREFCRDTLKSRNHLMLYLS